MTEPLEAEIAVVGAGPAGIAAATVAAEAGRRVVLVDEAPAPGGQIWRSGSHSRIPPLASRWIARLGRSGARVVSGGTVIDAAPSPVLTVDHTGQRLEIEAARLVLATGSRELFLPFPGWTLPGVIGVGAAQALFKTGVSFRDRRVVIAGSGPLILPVAASLAREGAHLVLVAEQATFGSVAAFAMSLWRRPAKLLEAGKLRAAFARCRYRAGVWVERAHGEDRLTAATLSDGSSSWTEPCDILCSSYGLVPNLELPRLLGCSIRAGVVEVDERQATSVEHVYCAGEPTGIGGSDLALIEGQIAGLAAAGESVEVQRLQKRRAALRRFADHMAKSFSPRSELLQRVEASTLVCRCEDVRWEQLDSLVNPRQAKLYTRIGMGACQGRVCGAAMQLLGGWQADRVRSPLKPCRVRALTVGESRTHVG